MKKNYVLLCILFSSIVFSQVGIGTASPATILDISVERGQDGIIKDANKPYGFQAPRLTLAELSGLTAVYDANHVGVLIYITDVSGGGATDQRINIVDQGYYSFDGSTWKNMVSSINNIVSLSSLVDPNILGYVPSNTATASSAGLPTITGKALIKSSVGTNSENGHSYALYSTVDTSANSFLTWYEAYNAAKELGGYLVTVRTGAEWNFIRTNIIKTSNLNGWIGMARFSWSAGSALTPAIEMKWITGEQPLHDYAAGGKAFVKKYNNFVSGEPNGSTQGFVYFLGTGTNQWSDTTSTGTTAIRQRSFIVEFQQ